MSKRQIKYTSKNGYTGVLYGESSLAICNKDGKEVMHTGSRNINTYDELVNLVEEYPKFIEMLSQIDFDDDDEDFDI